MIQREEVEIGGRIVSLETGKMAKQAGGAVLVRSGDSMVLVTAVISKEPKKGISFLPLTVDYVEKTFAAGKIPGGFFKREGRPSEMATLTSRFIDRPIRPLFPEGYAHETQIIATVLSVDPEVETDILATVGASAALMISEAPFLGPIASVRVGRLNGELVCNPTDEQMETSDIDLIVTSSKEAIVMVEGGADEVQESDIVAALTFAHKSVQPLLVIQEKLREKAGKPKLVIPAPEAEETLTAEIKEMVWTRLDKAFRIPNKQERTQQIKLIKGEVVAAKVPADDTGAVLQKIGKIFENIEYDLVRGIIIKERRRIDGRGFEDIRNISSESGLLPRAHGSALFTRGETQALVVTTLGSGDDEQIIDALKGEYVKKFTLHYNFPPFSTGETKPMRSPGRREVGHGALAERALKRVLPTEEAFPYTIRLVSEVLESNGTSSMASVCGGSLALMDAGVPMRASVAGIAMGLVKEGDQIAVLSDILGDEDHLGDMDFKVAGTERGVTALQMDIKITGVSGAVLSQALDQARRGRLHILGEMSKTLTQGRSELSPYAPRIRALTIPKDMIGALIGPGGKNIRGIVDETGAKVEVNDDGVVRIYSTDGLAMDEAVRRVEMLTAVPEVGKIYHGRVAKIAEFGAFVSILPNTDGLVHISELDYQRVANVSDILHEGDEIDVKVIRIEPNGKIALSRRQTMPAPEGWTPPTESDRPRSGFGGGGGRDRDRGRDRGREPRRR